MRNIFLLPTDQPTRLFKFGNTPHLDEIEVIDVKRGHHLYITSGGKIKEGDYCIDGDDIYGPFEKGDIATVKFIKIILTTDEQLIKGGVQSIDNDEFLEWFVKNPTCEVVEVEKFKSRDVKDINWIPFYKIIIPQEKTKQENQDYIDDCFRVLNGLDPIHEKETLEESKQENNLTFDKDVSDAITKKGQEVVEQLQEVVEEYLPKNADGKYSRNDIEKAFEIGYKSNVARDYWFEQFKNK
jgi:hypothetical protein